jgi:predicted MPP superfamily phosphohydrolase
MKKSRKIFIFATICALLAGCAIWGFFIEPDELAANHYQLKVKNWNPAFNNFKIVAIADIHAGSNFITEAKIRQVVKLSNAEDADLVVLLGDYVSLADTADKKLKMPVEAVSESLKGLKARFGVYAVLGNHDGLYGDNKVAAALQEAGIKVLENEVVFIEKDGAKFRLLGLKDHLKINNWKEFTDNLKTELAKNEQTGDILVLEHSPDILPIITGDLSISNDTRLILAAHTHGGQVRLPILGSLIVPSTYGQKYALGHIRENNVDMFVTPGIGTSILPVRFGVPPEISVLTLESE